MAYTCIALLWLDGMFLQVTVATIKGMTRENVVGTWVVIQFRFSPLQPQWGSLSCLVTSFNSRVTLLTLGV
jgi:hypothetical protein